MKPGALADTLEGLGAMLRNAGERGDVAGELATLAAHVRARKGASVKTAFKGVPVTSGVPDSRLGAVLGDFIALLGPTAKADVVNDVTLLAGALRAAGCARVEDCIAAWNAPTAKPKRAARSPAAPKRARAKATPKPGAAEVADEVVRRLRGASDADALIVIGTLSSKTLPVLRQIVEKTTGRPPPAKVKKADLIEALRRPYTAAAVRADKQRAIRSGGTL